MHELVAAIARDPQIVGWESWLTLSEAIANEEAWLRAIDAMALEDQFVLIDALKSDDSIYSDALQVLTARRANAISDEEVRDFLLTDASDASERFGNRLQRQREQLLALISSATARREADFDLAEEVTTLEMQLQERAALKSAKSSKQCKSWMSRFIGWKHSSAASSATTPTRGATTETHCRRRRMNWLQNGRASRRV